MAATVTQWPDVPAWELLAAAAGGATFFHTPQWHAMVVRAYPDYAVATRQWAFDDGTRAVLPMIQTKAGGLLKGKARLKSSVFGGYGGIVSDRKLSAEQQRCVYNHLEGLKASIAIDTNPFMPGRLPESFVCRDDATHAVQLTDDEEALRRLLNRGARSNLRQALKKGIAVRTAASDADISRYYSIYRDTLRRWGDSALFVYPEALFFEICGRGCDHVRLWLAHKDETVVAGAVIFYWNDIVSYWHGASLQDYFSCYPNNLLHMEIMRDASARGFRHYDFGPSGGQQGVVRFKQSFGARELAFVSGLRRYR